MVKPLSDFDKFMDMLEVYLEGAGFLKAGEWRPQSDLRAEMEYVFRRLVADASGKEDGHGE